MTTALQHSDRWGGPAYLLARSMAPMQLWGLLFTVLGALTLFGSYAYRFRLRDIGLYGSGAMTSLLGMSSWWGAYVTGMSSYSGGAFYVGVFCTILWVARTREVPPDDRRPQAP